MGRSFRRGNGIRPTVETTESNRHSSFSDPLFVDPARNDFICVQIRPHPPLAQPTACQWENWIWMARLVSIHIPALFHFQRIPVLSPLHANSRRCVLRDDEDGLPESSLYPLSSAEYPLRRGDTSFVGWLLKAPARVELRSRFQFARYCDGKAPLKGHVVWSIHGQTNREIRRFLCPNRKLWSHRR